MTDPFLAPALLGRLALANRVVMAPMTRSRAVDAATPHAAAALYYAQRASAGLIVSEGVCISPTAAGNPDLPGLWNERQVAAWRQIIDAVHAAGGRIVAQLWHLGRAGLPELLPDGAAPVGPSAVAIDTTTYLARRQVPYVVPRELSVAEIGAVVEEFASAARRARDAGFDGVELHGANGYLIDQFLHASSNRRTDAYGGTPVARTRFLREVAEAVCAVWGSGRVGVRLSPTSSFQDMHDPDPAELFGAALDALSRRELAYVHVVEPGVSGAQGTGEDRTGQIDAGWVRRRWDGGLIATGELDRERAAAILRRGDADAVGFARLFLANPDLPARLASGAACNEPVRETFYGGGDEGYIDYPTLHAAALLDHLVEGGHADHVAGVAPLSGATPVHDWPLAWAAARVRPGVGRGALAS
ncbi:N-ethylmaleimide reductase [Baekduia alba]|uniref:alkene reductase n=1 Tax=Baekduia alba TaxID=2997333 RepID=UPI00233FDAD7|nr:alkene reductase [Baekduia alba]WCB95376.1 N-ethylmaleimide reductase [Baekduia alba]